MMEEQIKLKELIMQMKKKYPAIDNDVCIDKVMESFTKWRPFFNQELKHWREQAEELVNNYY